ncbi:6-phosphogluconolactonase [Vibrio cidicii]|uniref:6-phosphogluconolactonase n=1 Tax=Vibrio cidicii TaxID=1763883 RepID=A0A151JE23_9VIBR|nr:lactonase family protein [Vibrio cidicii]KYN23877.1 6-phosphogluconolactonase [Vibrio cidicii]
MTTGNLHFYLGTYTDQPSISEGVAQLELNSETGELIPFNELAVLANPSYLTQTARGLYTFSEVAQSQAPQLVWLGCHDTAQIEIAGDYPCHLDIDGEQQFCAVANYGSGNTSIFKLDETGKPIGKLTELFVDGSGPNQARQTAPHAHQATFLRHSPYLLVVDLGADRLNIFAIDRQNETFRLHQSLSLPPGCGPRHLVLTQAEDRLYLVAELFETLMVVERRGEQWHLCSQQPLLPGESNGEAASAIRLSPDERFLYVSCRRQNKIAIFALSHAQPEWIGVVDTGGQFPRDFVLSRDGKWLLVANQHSHNVVSFRRDRQTGLLSPSGFSCQVGSPVCLLEHQGAC